VSKSYRVHVHDHNSQGRWLASADFNRRPSRTGIAAALDVLRVRGRYEVRINLVDGDGDEYGLASWLQDEAAERVIFRKFLDHAESDLGDGIIALFPDRHDWPGYPSSIVLSYMHVGQHSPGTMDLIGGEPRTTRPAKADEYAALKAELEAAPYRYQLAVIQRTPKTANAPFNIRRRTS
jgi:hypothetical protein